MGYFVTATVLELFGARFIIREFPLAQIITEVVGVDVSKVAETTAEGLAVEEAKACEERPRGRATELGFTWNLRPLHQRRQIVDVRNLRWRGFRVAGCHLRTP